MTREDIIKGLSELRGEFSTLISIECKEEDVKLFDSAIKELGKEDDEIINSLKRANKERKEENDLLKKENQELSKELELYKWAFEGLKSVYFEAVKIGEENGY